jgi:hypothetical protein
MADQWGTVIDTLGYQVSGALGDWIENEEIGLGTVGIDNEMSLSHLAPNNAFEPMLEQMHIDGNKGLIYSQLSSMLSEQGFQYEPTGKIGYVANPVRIEQSGTTRPPNPGYPAQGPTAPGPKGGPLRTPRPARRRGHQGSRGASITGTGRSAALSGTPSWSSAPISVVLSEVLDLIVSVKAAQASSAPSVNLVYLGAAGLVLDTVRTLTAPLSTDGFVTLERAVTIPAGVAEVRVVLAGFASTDTKTSGTVTFDHVGLYAREVCRALHNGAGLDRGRLHLSRSRHARRSARYLIARG